MQVTRREPLRTERSPAWTGLESAEQPAGSGAGILAVPGDFGSMDERVPVAPGALHDPPSTRRKIVRDHRRIEPQVREIDDIEVGAVAWGNHPAVMEPITPGRRQGLFVDQKLERQPWAARSIARPNREQAGRRTGVADVPNVRAPIRDTADRVAVHKHPVHDAKIAATIIFEGVQEEIRASFPQQQFQSEIERIAANCASPVGDAAREIRLVVQRLAEIEGAFEHPRHIARAIVIGTIFDQPLAQLAIVQNTGGSSLMIERLQRSPQGVGEEGMPGGLQAQKDADRA
jgi:hypothetical protein